MSRSVRLLVAVVLAASACGSPRQSAEHAQNLLLITIDTLRADHVGAYGYARAQTPTLDSLAARGVVFERAYAAAPITLPSHATILTGRYPPGHGSRDNGMRVSPAVPTLATQLHDRGFQTAAFVAAFPLDHQFGLDRGFSVYSDRLGRDANGRPANERPASQVVDEAIAWLQANPQSQSQPQSLSPTPFFLWVHFFEPHAPYGADPRRPVLERYDEEIATVDAQLGRLLAALGGRAANTLIVAAGDHGEAFGEHGEYAHSIFVYDTTLRVPLILAGPGIATRRVADAVTLADVAPTAAAQLGVELKDVDGVDLAPASAGRPIAERELYAESFAPLLEFGWSPLRSIRSGPWKYVAAPKPELYNAQRDPDERTNVESTETTEARRLAGRVSKYSSDTVASSNGPNADAAERLRALGYASNSAIRNPQSALDRPDPKDRRELAARIAQVTSGELSGDALAAALEGIVRDDPRNGQAHLRLGYARLQRGDCTRAEREFHAAAESGLPSADIYLGLATCLEQRKDFDGAARALNDARRLEPDNPVITANQGILAADRGDNAAAIESLNAALRIDPNLHEARFNLALALARSGRRKDALAEAQTLLAKLPNEAPQHSEVERLVRALQ